jgi:ATP-dependent Clp protease ATP-binding subunit ClpC
MSEYMEAHSVSRLIGSPPGYIGHEEGGRLTEAVRRKPYQVILLDELEKAHREVWNLLLQMMEEGSLTDAQGQRADFRNAVLVMTTNAGGEELARVRNPLGFAAGGQQAEEQAARKALSRLFPPEFLGRVDEIICFRRLDSEDIRQIASVMVHQSSARFARKGIALELTDAALDCIAAQGNDPMLGVRPMRRFIRHQIEDPAAELLLSGALNREDTLSVDGADGKLVLRLAERAEQSVS